MTHRLSTLRHADRIVLLEQGRVIEAGSRAELMARPEGAVRALLAREADAQPGAAAEEPA